MTELLHIDGAHGEGGGQLLRMSVALAALTGRPIRMTDVRGRRAKPGLHAQHATAIQGVSALCRGVLQGGGIGSREIEFHPGAIRGGEYRFDVGTAGSVALVLQACLPVALAADSPTQLTIAGGTDLVSAPPVDYVEHIFIPLLSFLGARVTFRVERRGYFPAGGGIIEVVVHPMRGWKALTFSRPEPLVSVAGISHVSRIWPAIATRMKDAALSRLASELPALAETASIEERVLDQAGAAGPGGGITIWAESAPDADDRRVILGADDTAKRGRRAEDIGDAVADSLIEDVRAGATFDVHAADQLLMFLAQAGQPSVFLTREATGHLTTMAWLLPQFLDCRISIESQGAACRVCVAPGRP